MEMTLAQKWRNEGLDPVQKINQIMWQEIAQAEGKIIAQRQTLSRMLAKRFPVELEESKKFAAYFAQINDFDDLAELIDDLLIVPTVAAFEERLKTFLPKETPKE